MFAQLLIILLVQYCHFDLETPLAQHPAIAQFTDLSRPLTPGIRIAWDHRTLTRISPEKLTFCNYPRMVQLHDETLLCVFEAGSSIMSTRSTDLGKTWSDPIAVAWKQDGIAMATPDVLELQDKSILVCYNPRPYKLSGDRCFAIRTRKSYDGGLTWIHGRLLYEAGHTKEDGCWEPSAIQLPDGEIQLFFANEGVFEDNSQNISLLRSNDSGLTWTKKPQVVSYRQWSRDGMPSPLLLKNGNEIVCAIEDLGRIGHFQPAVVRSAISDDWRSNVDAQSKNRKWALTENIGLLTYAGAPSIKQLSTGETLLSYQGCEGRRNHYRNSEMKVVIGDDRARRFNRKSAPFDIPSNRQGTWNSLAVLKNDTIVALTSTNGFAPRQEIWMIKGRVIPEIIAEKSTPIIDGRRDEPFWNEELPIFVGQTGPGYLRGDFRYDDNYLYAFSRVRDRTIGTDLATIDSNDGVTIMVCSEDATTGFAPGKPREGAYSIFVSANDQLAIKEGRGGRWTEQGADEKTMVSHASRRDDEGYTQELAIPWTVLGGKPTGSITIGVNMVLTDNNGKEFPEFREGISSTIVDRPYTWLPLSLNKENSRP